MATFERTTATRANEPRVALIAGGADFFANNNRMRLSTLSLLIVAMSYTSVGAAEKLNAKTYLAPKVRSMPHDIRGPFVHLDDSNILALNKGMTTVSSDGGKSWSKARPVFADSKQFEMNAGYIVRTVNGTIVLAFVNNAELVWKWNDARRDADAGTKLPTYVTRSTDNGKTWETPQKLHDEWTGDLRRMIQMRNGTIVLSSMQLWNNPGRHVMLTYASKDDGKTWTRSNFIDLGGNGHHDGAVEGTIAELNNGRLWMLIRTNWDVFWESFSDDDGITWKSTRPSTIQASSSPGQLLRLKSGQLVLLWNRLMPTGWKTYPRMGGLYNKSSPQWSSIPASASREELAMAFSDDDGKTWSQHTIIAARDDQVSYPYVFEAKPGTLWVTSGYGNLRAILDVKDFKPATHVKQ